MKYYLTLKSTFWSEKPKKLEKTSLNVKYFDWDYLHLTALMKETYFNTYTIQCMGQGISLKGKGKPHDLTFSAHTINCVCHSIRSMFRVFGIYKLLQTFMYKKNVPPLWYIRYRIDIWYFFLQVPMRGTIIFQWP